MDLCRVRFREAGFSLVEAIIATALTLMLASLVVSMSMSGTAAQKYAERMARVTEITQSLLGQMQSDLLSSVRLFHNDALGLAYIDLLDLSGLPTPSSTLLPTLDSRGVFSADVVGKEKTGSALLFARHAWTDEFQTIAGKVYRVDVYRMEAYYLSQVGDGPKTGSAIGLNMVRYVSEPMADGPQLDRIIDPTDRAEVLVHLLNASADKFGEVHDQVEVTWRVGEDPALGGTLRQILLNGSLSDTPAAPRPLGAWGLTSDPRRSSPGMLTYRRHSVASNFAPRVMGVGRYAIMDNTGAGFPHGFEVQIIGPSAARQILLHLTLVSTNNQGRRAFFDLQVIGDTRDL